METSISGECFAPEIRREGAAATVAIETIKEVKDSVRADFLRQYSLDRLPNDAKLRQRAAEFLREHGKEDLAREVEARGQ